MLAGILAPTMVKYVQSAKLRRANEDVKMVGTAIGSFYNDLGEWPVWRAGNAMTGAGTAATAWSILKGPGRLPTAGSGWTATLLGTADTSGTDDCLLASHLGINDTDGNGVSTIGGVSGTATAYPDDVSLKYAWRGPYIEQFRADPWGNAYLVNVIELWPGSETGTGPCYVLCAGPNKAIETTYAQTGPAMTVGGDDIVFRIK